MRIIAKLINGADGLQVWTSGNLKRKVESSLALQEEIAGLIAKELSLKLGVASAAPANASVNPQAFELYVQARQAWNLRNFDAYDRAERLLEQALALDPKFARAHAALADVWSLRGQSLDTTTPWARRNSAEAERIVAKCREALALDPQSAEAHASLGAAYWCAWRLEDGKRELQEAVRLNPNYASARQWLGRVQLTNGEMDGALSQLGRAAELDPLSPRILDNYGWALGLAGRTREALGLFNRAIELQPNALQAIGLKANALADVGQFEEAAQLARTVPLDLSITAWLRVIALARAGKSEEVIKALPALNEGNDFARFSARAALRQFDAALKSVDIAWLTSTRVDWMLFHPLFDGLRGDQRFAELLNTTGLTEAHARAQAWRAAHPPEKVLAK